jgi:hypothetical protein
MMGWLPKISLAVILALILAWSAMVFTVELTLRQHKDALSQVGEEGLSPTAEQGRERQQMLAALDALRWLHAAVPCYGSFRRQASSLASSLAAQALQGGNLAEHESYLQEAKFYITQHLLCAPRDGKAWLDYGVIATEIVGFGESALAAWKRSALVSPREGWLVEKRLRMGMFFFPLLDDEAKAMMQRDIQTLRKGYRSRHRRILAYGGFDSLDALEANYFPQQGEKLQD